MVRTERRVPPRAKQVGASSLDFYRRAERTRGKFGNDRQTVGEENYRINWSYVLGSVPGRRFRVEDLWFGYPDSSGDR